MSDWFFYAESAVVAVGCLGLGFLLGAWRNRADQRWLAELLLSRDSNVDVLDPDDLRRATKLCEKWRGQ